MRKCCGHCFGDSFLMQEIDLLSEETGDCPFCLSSDVKLVEPVQLLDMFEKLLGLYEQSDEAASNTIETLLRNDWELFSKIDSVKAEMLLGLIFGNLDFSSTVAA